MRLVPSSKSFVAARSFIVALVASRTRAVLFTAPFALAAVMAFSANGHESHAGHSHAGHSHDHTAQGHGKPSIINLVTAFDGIDQYSVYGEVVDCDDLEGLTVTFGGYFSGESTQTAADGTFFTVIIREEGIGYQATATVTCNQNQTSDPETIYL